MARHRPRHARPRRSWREALDDLLYPGTVPYRGQSVPVQPIHVRVLPRDAGIDDLVDEVILRSAPSARP